MAPADFIPEAETIANAICGCALLLPGGGAAWIAPQYRRPARRYEFRPTGHSLYDGACGIGLFLAAVDNAVGHRKYRNMALRAVQPLLRSLAGDTLSKEIGIGGAFGLGSVIYALARMAQFLGEPSLLRQAERAANLISSDLIAGDAGLDIVSGAAGGILGLLTLHALTSNGSVLERARACGQHLLLRRTPNHTGYRTWPQPNGVFLTGFSHGAAGIAYALLRLNSASGGRQYADAAAEALAYESAVFVPEAGNWPDYRQRRQPAFMHSWCAGAPGIGLARAGALPVYDSRQTRLDIEVAIKTTLECRLAPTDDLCCGNMGRAEFLLTSSRSLSRSNLLNAARDVASGVAGRARSKNAFAQNHPGFFTGAAGIGYELLRMSDPDAFPSVLLWQ